MMEEHWFDICTYTEFKERLTPDYVLDLYIDMNLEDTEFLIFTQQRHLELKFRELTSSPSRRYMVMARFSIEDAVEYKLRYG